MDRDDDLLEQETIQVDDLCVGLTRPASVGGVPIKPFLFGEGSVGLMFMASGKLVALPIGIPVYFILRMMSASNPRIFAVLAAWMRVHVRCNNRLFWNAASFSPRRTRRWGDRYGNA